MSNEDSYKYTLLLISGSPLWRQRYRGYHPTHCCSV